MDRSSNGLARVMKLAEKASPGGSCRASMAQ
jgi:hypothetical protein